MFFFACEKGIERGLECVFKCTSIINSHLQKNFVVTVIIKFIDQSLENEVILLSLQTGKWNHKVEFYFNSVPAMFI